MHLAGGYERTVCFSVELFGKRLYELGETEEISWALQHIYLNWEPSRLLWVPSALACLKDSLGLTSTILGGKRDCEELNWRSKYYPDLTNWIIRYDFFRPFALTFTFVMQPRLGSLGVLGVIFRGWFSQKLTFLNISDLAISPYQSKSMFNHY